MTAYCFALQIISQIILKNLLADMPLIDLIGNRLFLYYIGYFALGVTLAHSTFSPFGFWLTSPRIYIQSALYFVLCVILRTMAQKMKIEHVDSPIWLEIAMTLSYTAFSTAISISLYQILRDYTLPQPIARIIDYMADKSYAIYLFHVLILEIALRLSMPLFSSHPFILAISIFITVTVTMLAFCSAVDISRQLLKKNA
jgi:surface polysaccharide O-acyltransferase-like enzyme